MEKLTAQQGKMVLEYFAAQAAEDAPQLPLAYEKHMWMTRLQASLAIEREVLDSDWDELLTFMFAYQSFDRDAGAYLHEQGITDTPAMRDRELIYLNGEVSFAIDNCWNNSGA